MIIDSGIATGSLTVSGSLLVTGSSVFNGDVNIKSTLYASQNITSSTAIGAPTGSFGNLTVNTINITNPVSASVTYAVNAGNAVTASTADSFYIRGNLGVGVQPGGGYAVYISSSYADSDFGLDSADPANSFYFLQGGVKKMEISVDTTLPLNPVGRILSYVSSSYFNIGNPSNASADISLVIENQYGNILLGPGLSEFANNVTGGFSSDQVQVNGNLYVSSSARINGNLTVNGTGSFKYLLTTYESSSVIYSSGSNQFGDASNDTQTLWGTVDIKTGPVLVSGSLNVMNGITGSLHGNADTATSASYALTASFATNLNPNATASYALQALSASEATLAQTASYVANAVSASRASSAFIADTASYVSFAQTASFVQNAQTASYVTLAQTASYVTLAQTASYVLNAVSASYALSASEATLAQTASYVQNGVSSSYAISASYAVSASEATLAENAISSSYATNAPAYLPTASYLVDSASFSTRDTNLEATASTLVIASASFSIRDTDLEATASTLVAASASFSIRDTNLEATASTLVVASASFALVSASYSTTSGSLNTRVTNLETTSSNLTNASASFSIRDTNLEATASTLVVASASLSNRVTNLESTASTAHTGSFTGSFNGSFTGSFSGSLNNLQGTVSHIPFFSGSQVLGDSTMFQVDNGPGQGFSIAVNQNGVDTNAPEALFVYQQSTSSYNVISGKGNLNSFLQLNIQNLNNGDKASSDIIATANNGDTGSNYLDTGINGGGYVGDPTYWVGNANDTYDVSVANNHYMGSVTGGDIVLFSTLGDFNGDAGAKIRLRANGNHNMSGSFVVSGSITGSITNAATASFAVNAATASSADDFLVRNNATVTNTLTAQTLVVQTITSSVEYSSGSNIFGSQLTNTQQLTGSVTVTGSLKVNGLTPVYTNQTSSMSVLSSSYAVSASEATLSQTASYVTLAQSASYVALAQSASYVQNAQTASYVLQAVSASYASLALTASDALNAQLLNSTASTTFATTGSNTFIGNQSVTGTLSTTGSNTLIGNTVLSGSIAVSGSQVFTGISQIIGNSSLTGSFSVTGSTFQTGNNTLIGNTVLSGSIAISGSQLFTGASQFIGNQVVTGSYNVTGSTFLAGNTQISGSLIISGAFPVGGLSASFLINGNTATDGYIRFNPVTTNLDTSVSASYIYVSGSTNDLYFSQNGSGFSNSTRLRWMEGNLYTGLLSGGTLATASSTVFTVSSGSGIIVSLNASLATDPFPTVQYLNWGNLSASISPLTASYDQQFVAIQSNGTIFAQGTPFNDIQNDSVIPLGVVLHQNRSTINGVATQPDVAYGLEQRTSTFIDAFGPLKLSGYTLAPSGSSTGSLIVGGGTSYLNGGNYINDPNNSSYVTGNGTNTSKIFRYRQSGSGWVYDTNSGNGYGAIDPTKYSNNGTLTNVGPGNWSIQRVFYFPTSPLSPAPIVVYYGNAIYTSQTDATANITYEPFVEAPNTAAYAIYLGAIVVGNNGNFTNATTFNIQPGGLFRQVGGSGGGGSTITTTLSGLSDVSISGQTNGQPLAWSTTAGKWINSTFISASVVGNASTATTASFASTASYLTGTVATASYAISSSYALSASFASNAQTASYVTLAQTASYVTNAQTASYVTLAQTASYVALAQTASYVLNAISASYALSSSYALSATNANTASYITLAQTASYVQNAQTASYVTLAQTASYVTLAQTASYVTLAQTASYVANAQTASYVANAQTASYVLNAVSASYATTASFASNATNFTASNILVTGILTAQTLVVQQVTASVEYSSGSNILGSQLTNTQQLTGSVTITGSLLVNNRTPLYVDQTSSLTVTSASYAATASTAATTFQISSTLIDVASVASTVVGSNNVFTRNTGSYTGAFYKYTAFNGTNIRAGEVYAAWNSAGTTTYTDVATADIGSTTPVTASVTVVTGQAQLNFQTNTSGWTIKSTVTYI